MGELKKLPRTPTDVAASRVKELTETQPFHELFNSKGFMAWRIAIEGELKMLDKLAWVVVPDPRSSLESKALDEMGLRPPVTKEDKLEVFMACRAVVNYMTRKLDWLKRQRDRHEQLLRESLRKEQVNG